MFKKKGVGGQRLCDQCKKNLRIGVLGTPKPNTIRSNQTIQISFVKHMSGRHTNINHFPNGVQNLHSSQSDKTCELKLMWNSDSKEECELDWKFAKDS